MLDKIEQILRDDPNAFETPCYVYDVPTVTKDFTDLRELLGTGLVVSLKANSSLDLNLRFMHVASDAYEVASLTELTLLSRTRGARVFINNPAMDRNLIRAGLGAKAHFIVDNLAQLRQIADLAGERAVMPLTLRLNASVIRHFNGAAVKVRDDHFGMDWADVERAVDLIRTLGDSISLGGLHLFAGSHTFTRASMDTVGVAAQIVDAVERRYGAPLSLLNLGGGFSPDWRTDGFDFAAYRQRLSTLPSHLQLLHESGRGIFSNCGVFVTQVVASKRIEDRFHAVCDGGIAQNFLLCQTENTFRKLRSPQLVRRTPPADDQAAVQVQYVGSSCNRDDVIGQSGTPIASPQVGDWCLFAGCGAYNATYTVSKFLGLREARTYVLA